jgi:hypothetical protein
MTNEISFNIQSHRSLAHPNVAVPQVDLEGSDVILTYEGEESEGRIRFVAVACYRLGSPNDEGFFCAGDPRIFNDSMYNYTDFPKLEFGDFYEVLGFDWSNGLIGADVVELVEKNSWKSADLKHFVYFMKDGTYECLCNSWHEM